MDPLAENDAARTFGMRILHVGVGNLGPGGVATYVRSVVEGQRSRGHDVVLSQIWSPPDSMDLVQEKVGNLAALDALRRKVRPDVVHAHSQLPSYDALGTSAIVTAHEHTAHCPSGGRYLEARRRVCERDHGWLPCLWGHYVDHCGSRSPKSFRWRMYLTERVASFQGNWIAPSRYTHDRLLKRGLDPNRVHLVHNPGPASVPGRTHPPKPRKVVFLGRLVPNKGVDVLLRAAALVPGIELVVLGDGPELPSLQNLSNQLGLGEAVRFLGWVGPEIVQRELPEASVLAVPSLWPEPFGLVALEAAALGIPVVASDVGGLRDVVFPGETGFLVAPGDVARWADALLRVFSLPDAGSAMSSAASAACGSRFSLDSHLAALDVVYTNSIGDRS
jgi:glycosyltransferase involved in cell wall biosynthesis